MTSARVFAIAAVAVTYAVAARADVPTYTFRTLRTYSGTPPSTVRVQLANSATIAVSETYPSGTQLLVRVREGSTAFLVNTDYAPFSAVTARDVTASGMVLYYAEFDASDPREAGLFVHTPKVAQLEVHSHLDADPGNLEQNAAMNEAGVIVFREDLGGPRLLRRYENGALSDVASCPSLGGPVLNDAGTIAYSCPSGDDTVLYRGTPPGSFAPIVSASSFAPANPGSNVAYGMRDNGDVGFGHFGAPSTQNGLYVYTGAAPVLAGPTGCSQVEFAEQGLFLCVTPGAIALRGTPDNPVSTHAVTSLGAALGGSTVSTLWTGADVNAYGQVAFGATLANGTSAIFLATPSSCDPDGDGHCSAYDSCPVLARADQVDTDGDGVGDRCDNCPVHPNPEQTDGDADGRGDACLACGGAGDPLPQCGTRVVGAGNETQAVIFGIEGQPERPRLFGLIDTSVPGMTVDVALLGCDAPPDPLGNDPVSPANGDGRFDLKLYESYAYETSRVGVTCTALFSSSGAAGAYRFLVEAGTREPGAGTTVIAGGGSQLIGYPFTEIIFVTEDHDFRFLYDGTGGSNLGTCRWDPDPPLYPNPQVVYSPATGTGWDCCTFQYEGIDDVPSSVGQLIYNLNDAPPPPPDEDGDGYLTPCDSCPHLANDQKDRGGVGVATNDGIGDACQCAELTDDGPVDAADVAALRDHLSLAAPLSAAQLARCSAIGAADECSVRTLAVVRRALGSLEPGVQQVCTAAQP